MEKSVVLRITWIGILCALFVGIIAQDEIINATINGENIYSPGYFDGAYSNNLMYEYLITTWYSNHTIVITLLFCDLEYIDKAGCADWFKIYDGVDETADLLVDKFCCQSLNLPSNQSTGSSVYIVFQSDSTTNGRGFKLGIISDGPLPEVQNATLVDTNSSTDIWDEYSWIIIGSAYGGLNLIGVFVTVCFVFKKKVVVDVREPDLLMTASRTDL